MEQTAVVGMARTPFGKFGGTLKSYSAADLGGIAIKEAVRRSSIEPDQIEYAYMGQVLQSGCGQIPSRQATMKAGLPWETVSVTVNKVCSSGMAAVAMGDMQIRLGQSQVVVAGGMESMSNVPFSLPKERWGAKMGDGSVTDLMIHDGLWCAFYDRHMAVHGSLVSAEYGISREEQDEWALRSQELANDAAQKGRLREEIVPVKLEGNKKISLIESDEAIRPNTTIGGLAKLPPIFMESGTVTAGNAPGINDGAAALVLMAKSWAESLGIPILATIEGHEEVSQDAKYIATVPALSTNKLLKKHGLSINDISVFEANEAFAAVVLISGKITGWNPGRVNIDGGAIAFGHPLGASGARIIIHAIQALRSRGGGLGVTCICSGGAQGNAMLISVS
ncbi:MAG: acetyl-CoA C-acetyltransferase [Synergistaceae bacterium]|nr:acetyl-CoA C-acetyltransferase [Synergistaceae bacterium]